MESERLLFKFYKSYFETAKMLDDKNRLAFYDALFEKQFYGIEPKLDGLANLVYVSQKHSIDAQVKGWEDKMKQSIAPPMLPPIAPPTPQLKEEVKEQLKEEKKNNMDAAKAATQKRISDFKKSLFPFTKFKGGTYDDDMVKEFFEYWSELNKSGTKMKWELQETFEIGKRLSKWLKNNYKFYGKEENNHIVD
jgi:hypothetical protein